MKGGRLTLSVLKDRLEVCRLGKEEGLPEWVKKVISYRLPGPRNP
jgi:hypothetical protein